MKHGKLRHSRINHVKMMIKYFYYIIILFELYHADFFIVEIFLKLVALGIGFFKNSLIPLE